MSNIAKKATDMQAEDKVLMSEYAIKLD